MQNRTGPCSWSNLCGDLLGGFSNHFAVKLTNNQASSFVCLHLLGPWSCCDHDLWPFDSQNWRLHPCPKMHQCWKFGNIQSSNFQDITLARPQGAFSSMLDPLWPWTLTFWPKIGSVHPCPKNAPMLKVWWKYFQYISRYCVNNVRDARLTDRQSHQQPK